MPESEQILLPPDSQLTLAQLRQRMTERLNRSEVATLWFDLFGTTLDNDLPGRSLQECVIELTSSAEIRLRLRNAGTKIATDVFASVVLPEGCIILVSTYPVYTSAEGWRGQAIAGSNLINVDGPHIVHAMHYLIPIVVLSLDAPDKAYDLKWTARAGNMPKASEGMVRILPYSSS